MKSENIWMKKISACLLCVVLTLPCLTACGGRDSAEVPPLLEPLEISLQGKTVSRGDIQDIVAYKGSVKEESVAYAFDSSCLVDDLPIYAGQEVKQGDLIAKVNTDAYAKELGDLQGKITYLEKIDSIETALESIDAKLRSMAIAGAKTPDGDGNITEARYIEEMERSYQELIEEQKYAAEQRAVDIETAKSELTALSAKTGSRNLYAKEDGRVIYAKDYSGDNPTGDTGTGEIVAILAKEDACYIASEMPMVTAREADELYAMIGKDKYPLTFYPYEESELKRAASLGISLTGRFTCSENLLDRVGEEVTVYAVSNARKNVLSISPDSLFTENNVSFVYLLQDGEKVKREVETGVFTKNAVEITSGLSEGELVYCQSNDVPLSRHQLLTVEKTKLEITKRYDQAKVSSLQTVGVLNRAEGAILQEMCVKNGDEVKKGDVIARLFVENGESDASYNQVKLDNLKSDYDYAVRRYNYDINQKQKQLDAMAEEKTTSTITYKELSAEVKKLKLWIDRETAVYEYESGVLNRALQENDKTTGQIEITAPMDGIVRETAGLTEGYSVEKDSLICKVVREELSCIKVFTDGVNVPVFSKVAAVGKGDEECVGTVVSSYHDVEGVVYPDGMYLNEASTKQNDASYVVLEDEDAYERLKNLGVKINVWNVEDAIVIDSDCVYQQGDTNTGKRYVWVSENGDLFKRYVTVGYLDGELAWIVQGLSEGEQVVLEKASTEEK